MGFPLDLPEAVTYTGTIASQYRLEVAKLRGISQFRSMIQIQAPIAKGFSGSPVVDQTTGQVIGVVDIKIGSINNKLVEIVKQLQSGPGQNMRVNAGGVDVNEAMINLISVLDAYLSAGSGAAVSVSEIYTFAEKTIAEKVQ